MKVVEDFLHDELFIELSYWLCGSDIAWFFNPDIAIETEEKSLNCYFTHMFYIDDNWCSALGNNIMGKVIDYIKDATVDTEWEIKSLIRIKANLYPRTENLQAHPKPVSYTHLTLPTNREV